MLRLNNNRIQLRVQFFILLRIKVIFEVNIRCKTFKILFEFFWDLLSLSCNFLNILLSRKIFSLFFHVRQNRLIHQLFPGKTCNENHYNKYYQTKL